MESLSGELRYERMANARMDWFMIRPEFRRNGFDRQVLFDTIEYCRKLGSFKYFRLDTVLWAGRPAVKLYDNIMELREVYDREVPIGGDCYLVYSYSLHGDKIRPWNNQLLDLKGAE